MKTSKIIYAIYCVVTVISLFILLETVIRLSFPEIKLAGLDKRLIVDSLYNSTMGIAPNVEGITLGTLKSTNEFNCWKYNNSFNKNEKAILLLGDSVPMGIGVTNDSTFAGILSKSFNILNTSLIGYNSYDYINVFNSFILENKNKINYKEVIVFWTLNDVYSNLTLDNHPSFTNQDFIFKLVDLLRKNSKSYIFIKNLLSERSKVYYNYEKQFYQKENKFFIKATSDLAIISKKCSERNIKLKLFLLPYEWQIRNYSDEVFFPQKILNEFLSKDINAEIIDCKYAFKNYLNKSKELYLYGDGIHFSEFGHKIIADFIKTKLTVMQ